jgi:hypothetical protein
MLPLKYIAGLGQLVRDLISLEREMKLLKRWSILDHLFVAALLSDRAPSLRRFSESLASEIDDWFESKPLEEKSILFTEWVMGISESTRTDEVFGSLGIKSASPAIARKRAYVSMLLAIVLHERSTGVSVKDIERQWELSGLEGAEESWRDTALWLLSGHAALFDIRCFYHHVFENCSASAAQIRATKHALVAMRRQAYDLLKRLQYCSPLGPLVHSIRASLRTTSEPTLDVGTIRRLEAAGVGTLQQLASMEVDALVAIGIQKRYAKQIHAYIHRSIDLCISPG